MKKKKNNNNSLRPCEETFKIQIGYPLRNNINSKEKLGKQRRSFVKTLVSGTGSKIPEQIGFKANRK